MVLHRKKTSKRQTSRHRAKVTKKVREHQRKLRKGAAGKKHGKKEKDPGVPANFPQKEAFLEQLSNDRQAEKEHMKRQRSESERLQDMLKDAETRNQVYVQLGKENPSSSKVMSSMMDSSKKAYLKEFKQVIESSDVILEVLDARDPQGCRVPHVEEAVREAGKKLVLIMNKTDLVPTPVVRSWLAHLRRNFPTVAFKSSINSQKAGFGVAGGLTANDAMGADQLIELLKNYCRNLNIKTAITVGVVGYPNVGKSSLINSLKRSKVCRVGATPGITTTAQYVHLDRNITLLDCPGIVFSTSPENDDSVFLRNVLKVEQLEDPIAPVAAILKRVSREQLVGVFGCSWNGGLEAGDAEDVSTFLRAVALSHGRLKKGGIPDLEAAARFVLMEWNAGKVRFWNEPPSTSVDTASDAVQIVGELAPEFAFDDAWLEHANEENNEMDVDA